MIKSKHISMFLIAMSILTYIAFGDVDNEFWNSFMFAYHYFAGIMFCQLLIKSQRDKISKFFLLMILGTCIIEFALNLYSFIDIEVFDKINRSWEIEGILLLTGLIYIFYYGHGRLAKK